jgi:hypothetical protein
MRDLAVVYRIYPGISKVPAYNSVDKFKLSELCLRSFKAGLGNLSVKVWALLDNCPPEYEQLFRSIFCEDELEVLAFNKEGNLKTFRRQIEILTTQTAAEFVYFAEDDYFYFPDTLPKMITFMRENKDVDFVTAYDHPDSYDTSFAYERHLVRPFMGDYWRTASNTCLTFLTTRQNLIKTKGIFLTYSTVTNWDYSVWLSLTQKLSLADLRIYWSDELHFKIWLKTLFWGIRRVLCGRYWKLWCPMPALATHMESTRLAPIIDWPAAFHNFEKAANTGNEGDES